MSHLAGQGDAVIDPVYSIEVVSRPRQASSRCATAKYGLANHIEVSPVLFADDKAPVGFTDRHLQRDLQVCGVRNSSGQHRRNRVQAKWNIDRSALINVSVSRFNCH
jgi:hypothetical protein